jgi:hypothetical protein
MALGAVSVLMEIIRERSFFLWISIGAASAGILALLNVALAGQMAVFVNTTGILLLLDRRFSERYTFKRPSDPNIPVMGMDRPNVFRKSGKVWEISYQGVACPVKHSIGLLHIRNLIINSGKWIHCSELKRIASGIPGNAAQKHQRIMGEAQAKTENLNLVNKAAPETLVDRLSLEKLKKLRDVLRERRESDDFTSPEERIDQLKTLDFIEKYIDSSTDLKGRPRKTIDPVDTDRKAVSIAITRSRNSLSDYNELFIHLKSFIQAEGNSFRYLPDRPITWLTD